MLTPILAAEHITRRSAENRRTLIDDVSIAITAGESVGLVGPSGSGKTILMRALVMLDPIDEGRILWQAAPVPGPKVPEFRSRVVYLPQHVPVNEQSVEAFLREPFGWRIHRHRRYQADRINGWLDICGLGRNLQGSQISQLSGGERQAFAVLRALQLDPTIVMLDEATASMDTGLAQRLEAVVREWQRSEKDRAIIWTSHSEEQIGRMTDRLVAMKSGRVIAPRSDVH